MTDTERIPEQVSELIQRLIDSGLTIEEESSSAPLESSSAVLFHKGGGKYDIQANTTQGLKCFRDAVEVRESRPDLQSEFSDPFSLWFDPPVDEDEELEALNLAPGAVTADDIWEHLEQSSGRDLQQAIIEAEAVPLEGADRNRFVEWLKRYIEEHRDSTDREELVAVASAIRKCIAMLDVTDMSWVATLLEVGHRSQPSLDAELEIAKMAFRRYSAAPPELPNPQAELSCRLAEIAIDYLRPRIFKRERYSTVAMLATQAVIVMRSEYAEDVIDQVNRLPFSWFRRQLRRRLSRVVEQLPGGSAGMEHLRNMIAKIEVA